jgi:NAD(P)-dependent dehydrogenase (short-subunit alcohol dehydrogenase family)
VSLILVIGGYGGFGARLCRRLSSAGHALLVAGRSEEKAARFCGGLDGARPLVMDRRGDVGALLARERPDLVIDAAGPFQQSRYDVPRACIAAAIPYLDLADGRDFVLGIGALDREAREAGIAVISGASSVPALTGAVARKLAEGMDRAFSVDIALSAANRATGGASVVAAILSYVGKPVRLRRGGRRSRAWGWQEIRREDFELSDGSGLRGRLVAIADVPDHELLPESLPGRPAVTFRAGTELRLHMIALWLASWPVRWGWLKSLSGARRWLLPLYGLTSAVGGERSAMSIVLCGQAGGRRVERRWTVVAERGEGLEVPTLAAELLAGDMIAGRQPAGARTAAALLPFERFEPALAELALRHESAERDLPPPLYARIMGAAFDRLPPAVRRLHDVCRDSGADGEGRVERGRGLLARVLAAAMRFPPEGRWPLHVAFAEAGGIERWTRDFGGHRFSSELSADGERLVERFGPLRFAFDLPSSPDGLAMRLRGWSAFKIPLPLALAPRIRAREWEEQGRFRFAVAVALPLAGEVVAYSGWLEPVVVPAKAGTPGG